MKAMSGSTPMPASPRKARLAGDGMGTSYQAFTVGQPIIINTGSQ